MGSNFVQKFGAFLKFCSKKILIATYQMIFFGKSKMFGSKIEILFKISGKKRRQTLLNSFLKFVWIILGFVHPGNWLGAIDRFRKRFCPADSAKTDISFCHFKVTRFDNIYFNQSCKIAYPSLSPKTQKIGKMEVSWQSQNWKQKWKFLENFLMVKNGNLEIFLKISQFWFFCWKLQNIR